jgi:pyruvate dehydrogenase E2 component (dihydrolipoamide acetyltransferase)
MATKIVMPKFSDTMIEGTIVKWLKKEGEIIKKGEPLVEVMGDKLTYEVEAPTSGVLLKVLAPEESVVPVNHVIAIIGEHSEELYEMEIPKKVKEESKEQAMPKKAKVKKIEPQVRASPAAKRLAREYNIDLMQVKGTGFEGRITEEDVKKFVEESKVMRRVKEIIPLIGVRKVIAERMLHSARKAPHVTLMMEVDGSEIVKLRQEFLKKTDVQVSYTDILVKAVAKALEEYPILNSTLENGQIKIFEDINIGVAVNTERGLVVPVVHNANKKSLIEIASILTKLIEKARKGILAETDLTGGTFTISNLGMLGVDAFTPIINPPECAILGVGRLTEKPVAAGGKIDVRPIISLCLSIDHRIVDGYPAAQFLGRLKTILENPTILLNPK